MPLKEYPPDAVARAREGAWEWLEGNGSGYPRSWAQEEADDARRGYVMFDDFEAPPIAGYEALEREGLAIRVGEKQIRGQTRVRFDLAPTTDEESGT